jgi:hypothetical protein
MAENQTELTESSVPVVSMASALKGIKPEDMDVDLMILLAGHSTEKLSLN